MFAFLIQKLVVLSVFFSQVLSICLLHAHAKDSSRLTGMDVINELRLWVILL